MDAVKEKKGEEMKRQAELMTVKPRFESGDAQRPIAQLIRMKQTSNLLVPEFQRDFVWDREKKCQWMETVINHQAIGSIVTYQVNGNGPMFLCDGLQRLRSTEEFRSNPQAFGFKFGPEQAEGYCEAFCVTVQHRHYSGHREAMLAFQNVNKGTTLTAAEFHKGELVLDSHVGHLIHDRAPVIVHSVIAPRLAGRGRSRKRASLSQRDSFAMFYQYVTQSTNLSFWNVGRKQPGSSQAIESKIREWIDDNDITEDKAKEALKHFEVFLASEMAFIDTALTNSGQERGKPLSGSAARNLLHTAIWRRNAGRPRKLYEEFVSILVDIWKDYASCTCRVAIPGVKPVQWITLQTARLSQTKTLCRKLGITLFDVEKRKRYQSVIGYDASHIRPFSEFGEGEIVLEPSGTNRARGAKEIQQSLVGSN